MVSDGVYWCELDCLRLCFCSGMGVDCFLPGIGVLVVGQECLRAFLPVFLLRLCLFPYYVRSC